MSTEMKNVEHNTIRILPHNSCDFNWKDLMARNYSTDRWHFQKSHLLTCLGFDAAYHLDTWLRLLREPFMASLFALGFYFNMFQAVNLLCCCLGIHKRILGSEAEAGLLFSG